MFGHHLSVGVSLLFVLSGSCLAATPDSGGGGEVKFSGRIVESSCTPRITNSLMFGVEACPGSVMGGAVSVSEIGATRSVDPLRHSKIDVRLVDKSSNNGLVGNHQYTLVDSGGAQVRSGTYLITVTYP